MLCFVCITIRIILTFEQLQIYLLFFSYLKQYTIYIFNHILSLIVNITCSNYLYNQETCFITFLRAFFFAHCCSITILTSFTYIYLLFLYNNLHAQKYVGKNTYNKISYSNMIMW